MENQDILTNVGKATRQELMDGYRALLKKYKETAGGETEEAPKQHSEKVEQYQNETGIHESIHVVRSSMQNALADLETKLSGKFAELKQFDEAIAVEKARMQMVSIERIGPKMNRSVSTTKMSTNSLWNCRNEKIVRLLRWRSGLARLNSRLRKVRWPKNRSHLRRMKPSS